MTFSAGLLEGLEENKSPSSSSNKDLVGFAFDLLKCIEETILKRAK
jgi:hypothetical protein